MASLFRSHPAAARPDVIPVQAEPTVFVPARVGAAGGAAGPAPEGAAPEGAGEAGGGRAQAADPDRVGRQAVRRAGHGLVRDGCRPMLAKGCALRPGATVIKAALVTAVQSEVAGQAVAQVTEDVYDADGVGGLLIPQGTRVVGVYKAAQAMTFDRRRLDFGWTEMTLPDGTQIDLGQADGADASGAAGVGGKVG